MLIINKIEKLPITCVGILLIAKCEVYSYPFLVIYCIKHAQMMVIIKCWTKLGFNDAHWYFEDGKILFKKKNNVRIYSKTLVNNERLG